MAYELLGGGSGTLTAVTITSNQIGFGSPLNELTSNSGLTWNNTNKRIVIGSSINSEYGLDIINPNGSNVIYMESKGSGLKYSGFESYVSTGSTSASYFQVGTNAINDFLQFSVYGKNSIDTVMEYPLSATTLIYHRGTRDLAINTSSDTSKIILGVGISKSNVSLIVKKNIVEIPNNTTLNFINPSTNFYTSLKAGSNTSDLNLTLPIADGTNGQVLQTNGFGILSFVSPLNGVTQPQFSNYTSTTKTIIDGKLDTSNFNSYSGTTKTIIDGKLDTSNFNSYSGSTLTNINTRLIKSDFDVYSGNTNTRINTIESNYVSGGTNLGGGTNLFSSKNGKNLEFNTLSGGTNISLSTIDNKIVINSAGGGVTGITTINNLTSYTQTLVTGNTGSDFNISSVGNTHSFNLPFASGNTNGKLSSTDWNKFNNKLNITDFNTYSSSTLTNINTRLVKSNFDTYSGDTNNRITTIESSYISGVTNVGGGLNIYKDTTNKTLNFNTLIPGANISISPVGDTLVISSSGGGGGGNTSGITMLNGLTALTQNFLTGLSGSDFNISSTGSIHTFNLPIATTSVSGKLSSTNWNTFNNKIDGVGIANQVTFWNGVKNITGSTNFLYSNDELSLINQTNNVINKGVTISQNNNGIQGGLFSFKKSRGSFSSPSNLNPGDEIGLISFKSYKSGAYTIDRTYIGSATNQVNEQDIFIGNGVVNNDASPVFRITSNKKVTIGDFGNYNNNTLVDGSSKLHIKPTSSSEIVTIVQGVISQSSDLSQWRDNANNNLLSINSGGTLSLFNQNQTKYFDNDNSNSISIRSPFNIPSNYVITLPSGSPLANQFLGFNGTDYLWNTLVSSDSTITGATNNGSGLGLYINTIANNLRFKTISGGTFINLSQIGDVVNINADLSSKLNIIDFNSYSSNTLTNINSRLLTSNFNSYSGLTNTRINTIESNYVSGATNLGGGLTLYDSKVNGNLNFKTIIAGNNVSINQIGNSLIINSSGGSINGTPRNLSTQFNQLTNSGVNENSSYLANTGSKSNLSSVFNKLGATITGEHGALLTTTANAGSLTYRVRLGDSLSAGTLTNLTKVFESKAWVLPNNLTGTSLTMNWTMTTKTTGATGSVIVMLNTFLDGYAAGCFVGPVSNTVDLTKSGMTLEITSQFNNNGNTLNWVTSNVNQILDTGGSSSGGGIGEALFTDNILVSLSGGKTLGKIANGQTAMLAGLTLQQGMEYLAQEFLNPSLGINLQGGNLYQKGISITSVQVNHSINIGSGVVTLRKILKNGVVINNPVANNGSFTHTGQNITHTGTTGEKTYSYEVDYSNYGTQIVNTTIGFVAPSYYGVGVSTSLDAITTVSGLNSTFPGSQELRNNKSRGATSFSPTLQRYFFIYPNTLGYLTSIKNPSNFEVIDSFILSTKVITLADGTTETYNIYMSNSDTTQVGYTHTFN